MFGNLTESRYSKGLTVVLIIVILIVLGLLGYFGYEIITKMNRDRTQQEGVAAVDNAISRKKKRNTVKNTNTDNSSLEIPTLNVTNTQVEDDGDSNIEYFNGYVMAGKIEIPAINLEYPILESRSAGAIEVAVAVSYTQNGINQPGNTVIIGHNYRDGSFFGKNDRLKNGDKVYITDMTGTRIKYNIYNIYEAAPEESDYFTKETNGKREIVLATCTDNSKARLIIFAAEE